MYVFMHIYIYIYIYICVHTHACVWREAAGRAAPSEEVRLSEEDILLELPSYHSYTYNTAYYYH